MKTLTIEQARRLVTYLVGVEGDFEDAMDRVRELENDAINHQSLIKLYTRTVEEFNELKSRQ